MSTLIESPATLQDLLEGPILFVMSGARDRAKDALHYLLWRIAKDRATAVGRGDTYDELMAEADPANVRLAEFVRLVDARALWMTKNVASKKIAEIKRAVWQTAATSSWRGGAEDCLRGKQCLRPRRPPLKSPHDIANPS